MSAKLRLGEDAPTSFPINDGIAMSNAGCPRERRPRQPRHPAAAQRGPRRITPARGDGRDHEGQRRRPPREGARRPAVGGVRRPLINVGCHWVEGYHRFGPLPLELRGHIVEGPREGAGGRGGRDHPDEGGCHVRASRTFGTGRLSSRPSGTPGSSRWPAARSCWRWGANAAGSEQILDTIVERAARLCRADVAQLYLLDGRRLPAVPDLRRRFPRSSAATRPTIPCSGAGPRLLGRVALDRRTQQIDDVLADPDYGRQDLQRLAGFRTLLSAPMLLGDEVVGVLSVWRTQVAPFSERDMSVLDEFAAQAAIALRQFELMQSLEARGAELASKVEQLEALREVGEAVSSSLDPDAVLNSIVSNAVRLTDTDGGSIMEYDERTDAFVVRAAAGSGQDSARTGCGTSPSGGTPRSSAGPRPSGGRSRSPTSPRCHSTRTWRPSTATAGGRCSRSRCSGATSSSAWS